ncbi:CcdC family protein [Paenibacillus sp. FJAT-26967]|uniref:CcdC family protein n=1 Tax=Paenibacillus sp. FJAT-26967 TaxID=1729690 RepID=UPI00083851DB|nr:cytochrome c biogenesis protein CcdC [Paenibacillus sp. FJAT-26967]
MALSLGSNLQAISLFGTLGMALLVLAIRMKASKRPVNAMKILMPPIGMSTGFLMFVAPMTRIPVTWGLLAFAVGAVVFAYPLIRSSGFTKQGDYVYLHRSKAFLFILIILLAIRMLLHGYVEEFISVYQTASVFFILAFGMLLPWRVAMYVQYRKLMNS